MEIEKILDFIQKEVPSQAQELWSAIDLLSTTLTNTKMKMDSSIGTLATEREFDRAKEYIEASKILAEINDLLQQYTKKYAFAVEEEDVIEDEEEDSFSDAVILQDKVDYEKFRVDEEVAYNVYTNFTHKKPAAFSLFGVKYPARQWKMVFAKICELLYAKDRGIFESFPSDISMQGTKRKYFSHDDVGMLKPLKIVGTDVFVETNLSANNIRNIIIDMLERYEIPKSVFQVYLSKDLSALHIKEGNPHDTEAKDSDDMKGQRELASVTKIEDKEKCSYYDFKKNVCMREDSAYFIQPCNGLRECRIYIEETMEESVPDDLEEIDKEVLDVIPNDIFIKRICPTCDVGMTRCVVDVEYYNGKKYKENKLVTYRCEVCKKKYVTDNLYKSYMQNKDATDINVSFRC